MSGQEEAARCLVRRRLPGVLSGGGCQVSGQEEAAKCLVRWRLPGVWSGGGCQVSGQVEAARCLALGTCYLKLETCA